jgi:hypothetical protein
MSQRLTGANLQDAATVTTAPVLTRVDRNFGLPSALYAATVGLYLAFVGVMATLFLIPEMIIPLAICAGFIVIAFGLAGQWARMKPVNDTAPLSWGQFSHRGIQTLTGHLTAGEAAVQVLVLPVLILVWGVSIAVIVTLT